MDVLEPRGRGISDPRRSIAIQGMDRDELEEAFIEMLHQKAVDKQMFKRSQGSRH